MPDVCCRPKDSFVVSCLKGLPPKCTLLIMDKRGRIILEQAGTWQQGLTTQTRQLSFLSLSPFPSIKKSARNHKCQKASSAPSSSTTSPVRYVDMDADARKKAMILPESEGQLCKLQSLSLLEAKGCSRHFTLQELANVTDNFSPHMVIGEGGCSKVYRAKLTDGRTAAVKVLKISQWSAEEVLREVEILSGLKHKHIIQLIGYSYSKKMQAVVYSLLKGSLKQNLSRLSWDERMQVAVGVAKALDYLHHACSPAIIHRDVKSSNILLTHQCQPQVVYHFFSIQSYLVTLNKLPTHSVSLIP